MRNNNTLHGVLLILIVLMVQSSLNAQTHIVLHTDETGSNVEHRAKKNIKF